MLTVIDKVPSAVLLNLKMNDLNWKALPDAFKKATYLASPPLSTYHTIYWKLICNIRIRHTSSACGGVQGVSPAGCTWAVWALKSRAGLRPASPSSPREEQYNLQTQGSARRGESSEHRKAHRGPVPVSRIPGAGAATARGADPGDAGPSELS